MHVLFVRKKMPPSCAHYAKAIWRQISILILEVSIRFVDNDEKSLKEWLGNRLNTNANGSLIILRFNAARTIEGCMKRMRNVFQPDHRGRLASSLCLV